MAAHSDTDFKQLFAFPELACELLRAAVPLTWARRIRPGDLERVSASYVNLNGQQRHDDIVWRIHRATRPSIHMLVEFQSRPEKLMALRMFSYVCLLCENLVRQRRVTHGRLPLVLPVVLYSGRSPWNVATSLELLRPNMDPYLEALQPELKYCVVDRSTTSQTIRALLELEQADERNSQLLPQLSAMLKWTRRQHNAELSRVVASWIRRQLGSAFDMQSLPPECSLEEIYMMFEHKFRDYEHLLEFQATERGREEGREQGLAEATIHERRHVLEKLLARAGLPVVGLVAEVVNRASADQLAQWIDRMIAGDGFPSELVKRPARGL